MSSLGSTTCIQITQSTIIALLEWQHICKQKHLKPNLIPQDVSTQWNLTYDMSSFVVKYWDAIDSVMADKYLKLQKFELYNNDWKIVEDLVLVLQVCASCSYDIHIQLMRL